MAVFCSVYDLPDRDCAAAASNGEFSIADGGVVKYKAYIDAIRKQLLAYSDVRTILVIVSRPRRKIWRGITLNCTRGPFVGKC